MEQTHRYHIGQMIKAIRVQRALTQVMLADKLKIRQPTLAAWESGKENITIDSLAAIATALNCSIDISMKQL